ncbi:MAG: phosphotransferase [Gammaproteobacteria bacterium]|nr:phosphotransferase [Gammaproteobacteria bacterium]
MTPGSTIPPQVLAAVPGLEGGEPPLRIEALPGGVVNRTFRIATRTGDYVLRLQPGAARSAGLGIDRAAEVEAQRLAAAAGLAPRVVAVAADHAFLVSEYVAGRRADAAWLATPSGMARFGATLARLRGLSTVGVRALSARPSLIERTRRLVAAARAGADPLTAGALDRALQAAEAGWQAAGRGRWPCLVHSDPNPDNVLRVPGEGLLLLDWEYAHLGDPLQDPAAWLQASPALRGAEARLLHACGLEGEADVGMLVGMAAVYDALGRAWSGLAEIAAGIPAGARAN